MTTKIKTTIAQPSSSPSIGRRALGGSLASLFILSADQLLGSRTFLGLATPSLAVPQDAIDRYHRIYKREYERTNGGCHDVARQVVDAVQRWRHFADTSGIAVSEYIDAVLAVKIISFESVMNPFAKAGSYRGLAQFSPSSGKFTEVRSRVFNYINGNDNLRSQALLLIETADKKSKSDNKANKKTELTRDDLSQRSLFHNVDVQVSALMFGLLDSHEHIRKSAALQKMPLPYIHAFFYLLHQLPEMALKVIGPHLHEETSVAELANKYVENAKLYPQYFRSNSGIYTRDGSATPLETLHRVALLLQQPFNLFYQADDRKNLKYILPVAPTTCRSRSSFAGWLACRLG